VVVPLSFLLATVAVASVPGPGAVLVVSPSAGAPDQPFTATYTATQHCTGQGWSQVDFYLDGTPVGTVSQSGCDAALEVTPVALSPGPHIVTASLTTPGGQPAAGGLAATYVVNPGGSPPPTPSPSATPLPAPTPTPSPSQSPATSPPTPPVPDPPGPPSSGGGPAGGPVVVAVGPGIAISALPGPVAAYAVTEPGRGPGSLPDLPHPGWWQLAPFALGFLGLLALYAVARLNRPGGAR
jgi:hypothetical protein